MPKRIVKLASWIFSISVIVACGQNTMSSQSTQPVIANVRTWNATLKWITCGQGLECSSLTVPYDYTDPNLGTFTLPVTRHLATDPAQKIGTLLTNFGGPGGSATPYIKSAERIFSAELLQKFDIVGWDPRGVGGSNPFLDCVDTMDNYFALDPSPDDITETEQLVLAAKVFADSCSTRSHEILPYVGTVDAANDMDVLRRALDTKTISYIGFSYGTLLGATWATLFPETVRAAVFDAAVDSTLGYVDDLLLQASGFETSLNTFLDHCDATACSFINNGESAREALDRILVTIDHAPLNNSAGRPQTNQGVAQTAIANALYGATTWPQLEDALSAVNGQDGSGLLNLFDDYFGGYDNGHRNNMIDAYFGVTCIDRDQAVTTQQILDLRDKLLQLAPRLGAGWIQEMLICAQWPVTPGQQITIGADTATRILVLGSTGDPATPLSGSRNMVVALGRARLIVTRIEQHTSYRSDPCATQAIDDYLVNLTDASDEVIC